MTEEQIRERSAWIAQQVGYGDCLHNNGIDHDIHPYKCSTCNAQVGSGYNFYSVHGTAEVIHRIRTEFTAGQKAAIGNKLVELGYATERDGDICFTFNNFISIFGDNVLQDIILQATGYEGP
jgi:hypothetical protein